MKKNNKGTPMKIISGTSKENIIVEFQDDFRFKKSTTYVNFSNRQVKNPYDITVYGVGAVGDGKYKTWEQGHITAEYGTWADMLRRCYSEKTKNKQPAYYGITTVCNEWKIYQVFAEWYINNKYEVNERLHLDKDILYPGNKVYSPNTCLLVPQRINMLLLNKPNKRGLPNGITKVKYGYMAQYNQVELGIYNTVEEAYSHYAKVKENKIKEVADEYRDIIPQNVYNALLNYKANIVCDQNYKNNKKFI